jgi:hypothetical protein
VEEWRRTIAPPTFPTGRTIPPLHLSNRISLNGTRWREN